MASHVNKWSPLELSEGFLMLLVAILYCCWLLSSIAAGCYPAPNYHLSLVLASEVQGDAVNCNTTDVYFENCIAKL